MVDKNKYFVIKHDKIYNTSDCNRDSSLTYEWIYSSKNSIVTMTNRFHHMGDKNNMIYFIRKI
jgi:hypothetical protein